MEDFFVMTIKKFLTVAILGLVVFAVSCGSTDPTGPGAYDDEFLANVKGINYGTDASEYFNLTGRLYVNGYKSYTFIKADSPTEAIYKRDNTSDYYTMYIKRVNINSEYYVYTLKLYDN